MVYDTYIQDPGYALVQDIYADCQVLYISPKLTRAIEKDNWEGRFGARHIDFIKSHISKSVENPFGYKVFKHAKELLVFKGDFCVSKSDASEDHEPLSDVECTSLNQENFNTDDYNRYIWLNCIGSVLAILFYIIIIVVIIVLVVILVWSLIREDKRRTQLKDLLIEVYSN
jgi:hypothetical protein